MAQGDYAHIEIPADDLARAQRFYAGVFGWDMVPMEGSADYLVYQTPGRVTGGGIGRRNVNVGPAITNYIEVASIDASLPLVEQLGGRVTHPREEVPGFGWWAGVEDSEGNAFGLFEPMPR